jgi:hypothetical protein
MRRAWALLLVGWLGRAWGRFEAGAPFPSLGRLGDFYIPFSLAENPGELIFALDLPQSDGILTRFFSTPVIDKEGETMDVCLIGNPSLNVEGSKPTCSLRLTIMKIALRLEYNRPDGKSRTLITRAFVPQARSTRAPSAT